MIAGGQPMSLPDTVLLALAVLLAASAAGAFNHWFERDIDALMERTRSRPFASGRLDPHRAWPLAFGAMIAAGAALAGWRFNPVCGLFVLAGALTYALVYTVWLKRRTDWNIVVGGAAGSFAVLAGAAAAGDVASLPVMLLAGVLFLWTPSHFWSLSLALAEDYRRAGVPMLPVTRGRATAVRWNIGNTLLLAACSLWLAAAVDAPLLWLGTVTGSGWLLWTTIGMARAGDGARAMVAFRASLIQLGLLLTGLFSVHALP